MDDKQISSSGQDPLDFKLINDAGASAPDLPSSSSGRYVGINLDHKLQQTTHSEMGTGLGSKRLRSEVVNNDADSNRFSVFKNKMAG